MKSLQQKRDELAEKFARNWSKPSPPREAINALAHAYSKGFDAASAEYEELVKGLEKALEYYSGHTNNTVAKQALAHYEKLKQGDGN